MKEICKENSVKRERMRDCKVIFNVSGKGIYALVDRGKCRND